MKLLSNKLALAAIAISILSAGCDQITFTDPEADPAQVESESTPEEQAEQPREYLAIGMPLGISTLDPTEVNEAHGLSAINMSGEGLYRQLPDGSHIEGVIANEPLLVEDNKLQFTIKDEAEWSDGSPVIAEDFVMAWRQLVDDGNRNYYGSIFNDVITNATEVQAGQKSPEELGVKAIDEKTLEITFTQAISNTKALKQLFSLPALYPVPSQFIPTIAEDSYGTASEKTLSNGPYTVDSWNEGWETWTFTKNPNYVNGQAYPTEQIFVQVTGDEEFAAEIYNLQVIDAYKSSEEQADSSANPLSTTYLMYNQYNSEEEMETPLANPEIRRIISQAIDKEELLNELGWEHQIANSLLPWGSSSTDAETVDADQLSHEFDQLLEENDYEALELTLSINESQAAMDLAEAIQKQVHEKIDGLSINIVVTRYDQQIDNIDDQAYDMAIRSKRTWNSQDPYQFYASYLTHNAMNDTGYSNAAYDALFEGKTTISDISDETYAQADAILAEDYAVTPLFNQLEKVTMRSEVVETSPFTETGNLYDFRNIRFNAGEKTVPLEPKNKEETEE